MDNASVKQLVEVRKAEREDVSGIEALIEPFVADKVLLPRSQSQIVADLPMTWVASREGAVVGVMNLTFFKPNLYEVRGLAVDRSAHRMGLASKMLTASLEFLRGKGESLIVFALTYIPQFFEAHGFSIVQKDNFPAKIYEVCQYCSQQHDCREIAVELNLDE